MASGELTETTAKTIEEAVIQAKADPASAQAGGFVVASLGKNMRGPFAYYPTGSPGVGSMKEILGTGPINEDAQIVGRYTGKNDVWEEVLLEQAAGGSG